ncbi:MAG: hypothetical protein KME20_24875 [Kaiparowitsia implicata GSE-PSE-MK54-09C]|jgi:hypothetical protein|nr:hypothetical protein [Kaiparowitsia implicata GSE-PSE-MK54-09C]
MTITELAQIRQGHERAIAQRLQQVLNPEGVTVHVRVQEQRLQLVLRGAIAPNQSAVLVCLLPELEQWQPHPFTQVELRAQAIGSTHPVWTAVVPLSMPLHLSDAPINRWTFRFDPLKLGFIAFLLVYGVTCAPHYTVSDFINGTSFLTAFIHGVNLIFHEAGHVIFMLFGRLMHLLGGSLMQILVPAGLGGYFFYTKQHYAGAVALCWTGENFWDVSIYIKDAQERLLPLLGGEGVMHDWHFILLELRLLPQDQAIGSLAYSLGVVIYAIALFLGVFYAQRQPRADRSSSGLALGD